MALSPRDQLQRTLGTACTIEREIGVGDHHLHAGEDERVLVNR